MKKGEYLKSFFSFFYYDKYLEKMVVQMYGTRLYLLSMGGESKLASKELRKIWAK